MLKERIVVSGNPDPIQDSINSSAAIRDAGWWDRAGQNEHWPLTTEDAAGLLHFAGEFDIVPSELADLVERNLIARPGTGETGLEWGSTDVLNAARVLEWRGQWRADSPHHAPKKSVWLAALEQSRQAGAVESLLANQREPRYDTRHLLATLERTDSRDGRAMLITLLRATLEIDHRVII